MTREQQIADYLHSIEGRIADAAGKAGRNVEEITLVAVSKNMPVSDISAAYRCGLRHFGENRVQEALEKVGELPDDISWHLLGRLQRNKARKALEFARLIHSLDRLELARSLHRIGTQEDIDSEILIEVNISGERSKAGISPEELEQFLHSLSSLNRVRVKGLMTILPQGKVGEQARPYFAKLRALAEKAVAWHLPWAEMDVLSMGMTDDFEAAILEGSNLVRIGRGIFGPRIM